MGIVLSVYSRSGAPIDRSVMDAMLTANSECAIDGQDTWFGASIALAHQHLWITPQEVGERQPLEDSAGRSYITADARLDNRAELLRLLDLTEQDGQKISDAALILLSYRRWGSGCAQHLLGDFAFIIWDAEKERLFLARDALGARGLCYYVDDALCLVATGVSQILAHPEVESKINEGKIAEFLVNHWGDQEETYYEKISYCSPAHCLVINAETVRKWRYWDIDSQKRVRYRDDREYADHYLELLKEAVRCRLRTVGPVGISMSGGLDSTALAAVASDLLTEARLPQKHLKSFSYVFDELASCDERRYIQPVVERHQLEATYIRSDDKWTLRDVQEWPVSKGYVAADPYAWLPISVLTAAREQGCRLMITGHYGDVLFTGGRSWAAGMLEEFRLGQLTSTVMKNSDEIDIRRDLMVNGLRHMIPQSWRMLYGQNRSTNSESSHPGLHPNLAELAHSRNGHLADKERRLGFSADRWHRYLSLTLNVFAQGADVAQSLYNRYGLQQSTPYWDRRLVEFVMAVPADQLGRPQRDRWVHRNAMLDLLPSAVRERRRRTVFTPLMAKGLLREEKAAVAKIMENPQIVERNYVQEGWLRQNLENGRGWMNHKHRFFLWQCLSLELWLQFAFAEPFRSAVPGGHIL